MVSFKFWGIILELQPRELELEALSLPQCLVSLRSLETGPWRVTAECSTPHPSHYHGFACVPTSPSNNQRTATVHSTVSVTLVYPTDKHAEWGERKMCFCS